MSPGPNPGPGMRPTFAAQRDTPPAEVESRFARIAWLSVFGLVTPTLLSTYSYITGIEDIFIPGVELLEKYRNHESSRGIEW